jgi:hypothetical protein
MAMGTGPTTHPGKKAPDGVMRSRVVSLFDAGRTVAEIVAEVGISKQAVHVHLHAAGLRSGHRTAVADQRERWAKEWNAAPDLASVAKLWGLTPENARLRRHRLSHRFGLAFKKFSKGAAIATLLAQGRTVAEIDATGIASRKLIERMAREVRAKDKQE